MSHKLIPNRYFKLYAEFHKKIENREDFTIFDIVRIMEEDAEPTDKLFNTWMYFEGIQDWILFDLKRFIYNWYDKDKIFERDFKEKISKAEEEMPDYLKQLDLISKIKHFKKFYD